MIRKILGTTALAVVMTAAAAPASAQQLPFSSTLAFGDSLSDTGNLVPLGLFPGAPYVNGRFSNGDVWIDYFGDITGAPSSSRAFGGARAIRTSPIDLTAQVSAYLATNPSIGANQLFSLWIGGNDYLALLDPTAPAPSLTQVQTTIQGVATALGTQAGRLRARGAQNFLLFNLPPLGQIPATSTASASARNDANTLSSLHAEAIRSVAANLRASGATVVIADVRTLFQDMVARPSVYGFANVTVPCFAPTATAPLAPTGACATAQGAAGTVFYDLIHPTTAAHEVIAQFANGSLVTSLVTPQALVTTTQLSFSMFDLGTDAVAGRMAGARTGTGNVGINAVQAGRDARFGVYAFGTWATIDSDAFDGQLDYEQDAWNAGIGIDYQVDEHLTAGVAFSYGTGELELGNSAGEIETSTYGITAYATVASGGFWADGFMGYSYDNLSVERATGFAVLPMGNGDTYAHTYGFGATTGYSIEAGGFGFGPMAALRFASTEVNGYEEEDAGPLALNIEEMTAESLKGRLGVQASGRVGDKGLAIVPSVELAYQREFLNDERGFMATLPGGETASTMVGAGDRNSVVLGAGLALETDGGLLAALGYTGTISGGNGDAHAVTARIRFTY